MNKKYLPIVLVIILAVLGALVFYASTQKFNPLPIKPPGNSTAATKPVNSVSMVKSPAEFKSAAEECRKIIPKNADTETIQSLGLKCMQEKGFPDAHFPKDQK